MRTQRWITAVPLSLLSALGASARAEEAIPRTPSPAGAVLYFVVPKDGETVASPVTVVFGLRGMGVAPAGVPAPNTGHHHLIVDAPLPPENAAIPADAHHLHFGGGQTETTLELPAGKHTLQLVLGDALHVPHQPAVVSRAIQITVK
jgi:hypothetical protein